MLQTIRSLFLRRPARKPQERFALRDYVALLRELGAAGIRFETLADPDLDHAGEQRLHFIKHDIHHDLENTRLMALAEHEIGVRSTYFMMHRDPINRAYFDRPETWRTLREMQDLGHHIGLHVDGFTLVEEYGDLAEGIDVARRVFAKEGIAITTGNTHGNSQYQSRLKFPTPAFYKEFAYDNPCTDERWLAHHARYSVAELGFKVWADTAVWTPQHGQFVFEYFVSDNSSAFRAGQNGEPDWVLSGERFVLPAEFRARLVAYVSQGPCIYLVHPQFFRGSRSA